MRILTLIMALGLSVLLTAPVAAQEPAATPAASPGGTPIVFSDGTPAATPLAAPVALVPYTNEAYGFSGVVPEGWEEFAPGTFARQADPTDPTLVGLQSIPLTPEAVLEGLQPQLRLEAPPAAVGEYDGPDLTWTLYQEDVDVPSFGAVRVDLALAAVDGLTYLVIVQSLPADADAYYNAIFLPMLDQFTPVTAAASPVAYVVEEVTFTNGDVTLAGTLTLPPGPGPHPALVLVSGSGPQDRDEYLGGGIAIRPFRLLADALTSNGYAVLRYDDRGVGQSTGDFEAAVTTDFASDAEAGLDYLLTRPEIDADQLGLLGHSEGGLVAAYLGARNADLAFIISLAGPGVSGREVIRLQTEQILRTGGSSPAAITAQTEFLEAALTPDADPETIRQLAYESILVSVESLPAEQRAQIDDVEAYAREAAEGAVAQFTSPWFDFFARYDPAVDWAQTTVPVLALFGGKDLQVDAAQNAGPLEAALAEGGNTDVTVVTLPEANHLFQTAETGNPSEYATLPSEFDPALLPAILDWLADTVETAP